MSKAVSIRSKPPATLKAESDIWNSLRRFCPRNKKRAKTMKRVKLALRAISFLSFSDAPSVKVRKSGAPPTGSTKAYLHRLVR
jgi:hypothetical protein